MKKTGAEKRVIAVLSYNDGSYISIGHKSHRVVSKDHRKLISFNDITLDRLIAGDMVYGEYPHLYLTPITKP